MWACGGREEEEEEEEVCCCCSVSGVLVGLASVEGESEWAADGGLTWAWSLEEEESRRELSVSKSFKLNHSIACVGVGVCVGGRVEGGYVIRILSSKTQQKNLLLTSHRQQTIIHYYGKKI